MTEDLQINKNLNKEGKYAQLIPQIEALIENEKNLIANLSNIAAALKYAMDFFWVGFYRVEENDLVLGPFQGPPACTRIAFGKGVCGHCLAVGKTVIVPDVDAFPGHIACSSLSRSEIVIPVFNNGQIHLILDVDSTFLNNFDNCDKIYLEKICSLIRF